MGCLKSQELKVAEMNCFKLLMHVQNIKFYLNWIKSSLKQVFSFPEEFLQFYLANNFLARGNVVSKGIQARPGTVYKQVPNKCTSEHPIKLTNPVVKSEMVYIWSIIHVMCLATTKQWDMIQITPKS